MRNAYKEMIVISTLGFDEKNKLSISMADFSLHYLFHLLHFPFFLLSQEQKSENMGSKSSLISVICRDLSSLDGSNVSMDIFME